ncbi:MAG: hypothetical protein M1828_005010 [Chrysothrix sp. TS-e1954]|nr:MAG: hypothetical protein M1828_005010 [Chrysothrix sp. TS-e1954]
MSHPDADLFPRATGAAAKTVEQHSAEHPLKLYSGWFCPFVQRAWLVLQEKKIPYQYIEVNPYHKPQSLLDLNPRGLVPTFQVAPGKPLYESNVICEYLDEVYSGPEHAPKLLPEDLYDRARMRIWQDWVTSRFIPSFHRFLQKQPASSNGAGELADSGVQKAREEFVANIKTFIAEMHSEGPYFMGAEPTLIDFVIAPWALRLWIFDHFKGGLGIPREGEGGKDEASWQRWRKWVKAVEARDSIRDTMSDREHYLPIYQRYAEDRAQSELAKATRSGGGVP